MALQHSGRRTFLGAAAACLATVPLGRLAGRYLAPGASLDIRSRDTWGAGLAPTGPMEAEAPGDVRVLVVHHSVGTNDYGPEEVVPTLQGMYRFHTGDKGWPDVAYNFFVDRFGRVWEGRAGSNASPVIGDATGGNQGFTQLACFVGDHSAEPPTPEALASMTALLAGLADRYGIATDPGSTATFTSRGSNKWPRGTTVTVPTIAGHRDLSRTACPGDAAYSIVTDQLQPSVSAVRLEGAATTTTQVAPAPSAVEPTTTPGTDPSSSPSTSPATETTAPGADGPEAAASDTPGSPAGAAASSGGDDGGGVPVGLLAAGAGLLAAGGIGAREVARRRDA